MLHELATNAGKCGALSRASGTVRVAWSIDGDRLDLARWEAGRPAMSGPPASEGFGSNLARRGVVGQLGGQLPHDWRPDGLAVRICLSLEQVPLAKLSAAERGNAAC